MTSETEIPQQRPNHFIMRPLRKYEDILTIQGWMYGSETLLFSRSMQYWREIPHLIAQELQYGYKYDSNIVIFVNGPMGEGKSTIARSLASSLQGYAKAIAGYNSKIFITFSNDETQRKIKIMKKGDILIQDEISRQSGTGSQTALNNILNIQEQIRQSQISLIFVSPTDKPMTNACNVIIEAWGMDKINKINQFRVISGYTGKYLGWGEIDLLSSEELEQIYEILKNKHVEKLRRLKGGSSVRFSYEDMEDAAKELIKAVDSKFNGKYKSTQGFFIAILGCGLIEFAGQGSEQVNVARLADQLCKIKEEKQKNLDKLAKKGQIPIKFDKEEIINTYGEDKFIFKLLSKEENNEIPQLMLKEENIKEAMRDKKFKKLREHHIETWKMFTIEGIDPSGIAKHFKKTRALILNKYQKGGWLAIFNTEIAGYLAEYAVRDLYYPQLKVYAGQGEPDLCDSIKKPTIMVEVKKRESKEVPSIHMLSAEEIEFVIAGGKVHLAIVTVGNLNTIVTRYNITLKRN